MQNAGLDEAQVGIKIARRNINNLSYTDTAAAAAKWLQSCPTLCDPMDIAHQAPPFIGFSRQEYWQENEDHGIQSHHFMGNRWGNSEKSVRLYFFWL